MSNFFSLSDEQKRTVLMQTAVKVGLPVEAVEKDRIILVPSDEIQKAWEDDYRHLQDSMIFGESLPFEKLLERMNELQNRFRTRAERCRG